MLLIQHINGNLKNIKELIKGCVVDSKMKNKKILLISHVNYINNKEMHGPVNNLINYLSSKNMSIDYIFHPLDRGNYSYYNREKIFKRMKNKSLNYILECFINNRIIISNNYCLIIAIDPLNCFSSLLFKKYKKFKLVYFSVDYSDKRFDNVLLNAIYQFIDYVSIKMSDRIWAVSTRIVEKRKKQTFKSINLIPNSPTSYFTKPIVKINNQIILVTTISNSINFDTILSVMCEIRRIIPNVKLVIVGDGPLKSELMERVSNLNLDNNIILTGALQNEEVLEMIAKSKIGLALYSGESTWNYYGDSMKAREYAARATPVILNNVPSTADDIKKFNAGIVLDKECNGLKDAVLKLLKDDEYYEECVRGCTEFSRRYDYSNSVNSAIEGLYEL